MSDKKRLTAKQVADEIERDAGGMCDHEGPHDLPALSYVEAAMNAARLVRDNLISRWQDEPDGEGEHLVEGVDRVAWCYREHTHGEPWAIEYIETDPGTLDSVIKWGPLNNRRVCPIGERPEAGE